MQEPIDQPNSSASLKKGAPPLKQTLQKIRENEAAINQGKSNPLLVPFIEQLFYTVEKIESKEEKGPALFLQLDQAVKDWAESLSNLQKAASRDWYIWFLEIARDLEAGLEPAMRGYLLLLGGDLTAYRNNIESDLSQKDADAQAANAFIIQRTKAIVEDPDLNKWLALEKAQVLLTDSFRTNLQFAKDNVTPHEKANQAARLALPSAASSGSPRPSHNFLLKIIARANERKLATALLVIGVVGLTIGGMALGGVPIAGIVIGLLTAKLVTAVGAGCFVAGLIGFFGPGSKKGVEPPPVVLGNGANMEVSV